MRRSSFVTLAVVVATARSAAAATDESPTAWGPSGLLHTPSALTPPAGTLRGAVFVDWFTSSNFLCTHEHPCGGPTQVTSDRHRHSGAVASLGVTLIRGLEAYLTGRAYVNESSHAAQLFEVIGETTLGARYARPIVRGGLLHVGGGAEVVVGSGPGDVGLGFSGTSFRLRAVSTLALDALPRRLPFRTHLAFAYTFDNTARLVRDVEDDRGQEISRVERQGLGINRVDRLEPSLGAEWLGFDGLLRPFVELGLALPINRQGHSCAAPRDRADPEGCLGESGQKTLAASPSKITVGARAFPVSREGSAVAILAGVDIGLGGTRSFVSQLAPQAPWTLWLGLSMSTSTTEWGPKIMIDRVEVPVAPPVVTIRGFVHPAGKTTPIVHAIVRYSGDVRPPLSTDTKGNFGDEVPPGSYELEITAPGYRPNVCGGMALAGKNTATVLTLDCPLEEEPPPAP